MSIITCFVFRRKSWGGYVILFGALWCHCTDMCWRGLCLTVSAVRLPQKVCLAKIVSVRVVNVTVRYCTLLSYSELFVEAHAARSIADCLCCCMGGVAVCKVISDLLYYNWLPRACVLLFSCYCFVSISGVSLFYFEDRTQKTVHSFYTAARRKKWVNMDILLLERVSRERTAYRLFLFRGLGTGVPKHLVHTSLSTLYWVVSIFISFKWLKVSSYINKGPHVLHSRSISTTAPSLLYI
jgi:hypothetical protein